MSNNRELSQFGSFISINDGTTNIGIATGGSFVGIGTNAPTSKLDVIGDAKISGVVTASSFSGNASGLTNIPGINWTKTIVGLTTLSNVGIGTTNSTSKLTVVGDVSVSGVITAATINAKIEPIGLTTFTSLNVGSSGTIFTTDNTFVGIGSTQPTSRLSVGGDVKISGIVTASSFVGSGSGLTGVFGTIGIATAGGFVGSGATTLDLRGPGVSTVTVSAGIATVNFVSVQGVQGIQGTQGVQGTQGALGIQGTKGDTGFQGVQGLTGSQGLDGVQGTHGRQGVQGLSASGSQGIQGTQGLSVQGTQGTQGTQGRQGVQGLSASGSQGTQGTQGLSVQGTQGTQGLSVQGSQGIQGNAANVQGIQGTQGTQGAIGSGSQGIQGLSGNSNRGGIPYIFSTSTVDGDPGNGIFRYNSSTLSAVNTIYLDNQDAFLVNQTNWYGTWDDSTSTIKGYLTITSALSTGTTSNIFAVTSVSSAGITGYWKIFVTPLATAGGIVPVSGETVTFEFSRTGDQGIQGTIGSGSQGIQGTQGLSVQGTQGTQGTQGRQGVQGLSGTNGLNGDTGSQGLNGTSIQGSQGIQGSNNGGVTIADDTTTNATRYVIFDETTTGISTTLTISTTKFRFNPSTGAISGSSSNSLSFQGNIYLTSATLGSTQKHFIPLALTGGGAYRLPYVADTTDQQICINKYTATEADIQFAPFRIHYNKVTPSLTNLAIGAGGTVFGFGNISIGGVGLAANVSSTVIVGGPTTSIMSTNNTLIGIYAGGNGTGGIGQENTCLGLLSGAGLDVNSNNNTCVGVAAGQLSGGGVTTLTNSIYIGRTVRPINGINEIVIGSGFNTSFYSQAIYSQTTTTGSANVVVLATTGQVLRFTSSIKYKTEVETVNYDHSENIIFNSRPVWFRSLCNADNPNWSFWGFIAEEVADIDPRLVFWQDKESVINGDGSLEYVDLDVPIPTGVAYDKYVVHLVAVAQRQKQEIESLKMELEKQKLEIDSIKQAINILNDIL